MAAELIGDRYRLGKHLGQGGMGKVWEAEDTVLQRRVAVKAVDLPPHLASDDREGLRTRVLREARTAARIDHPSSVRVFDVLDDDERIYVVMELVSAPTLESVVSREGPLDPPRAAAIGLGVLGALDAAHAAGIVHRDVKPANVMMLPDGGVKLTDFGIASAKDDTRITAAGLVLGTPSYMAPEQAQGHNAGPPADLWSLGALLYYAVEGVAPFERGEALPTLNAVLHDPPRPMEHADGLAPTLTALLAKAPEERPTAAGARLDLERVARPEAPATTAAAPSNATAVLPAATAERSEHRSAMPPPAPPPPDRRATTPGGQGWLIALGIVAVVAVVALVAALNSGGDEPPGATGADSGPPATESAPPPPTEAPGPSPDEEAPEESAPDPPATTEAESERPEGVPDGWEPYVDEQAGYSIWHPAPWQPQPGRAGSTDFVDPATGDYLRVDSVSNPGDDPVAAWETSSQSFANRYDDYQELSIEATTFRGYDAAVWEYTYQGLHATNLGIVTPGRGYALNFQTEASRWEDRQDIREAFESSFRIGGAGGNGEG